MKIFAKIRKTPLEPDTTAQKKTPNKFKSYYGLPILKKAHWGWHIWFYFWIGGIAAGASVIAGLAAIFGDKKRNAPLVRIGRYISLVGMLISPVLLIFDLKRPERFLHMLRVLKLRSPLNLGTYILTTHGVISGLQAARQMSEDNFILSEDSLLGKMAKFSTNPVTNGLHIMGGLALGSYTGVLLSATATPLWAQANPLLGSLFLTSAISNGSAAISLVSALTIPQAHHLEQLEMIEKSAILAETVLIATILVRLKPNARKYLTNGKYRPYFFAAISQSIIAPLILAWLNKKGKHSVTILSALMVLSGGFWLRFAIVEAGKASADAPELAG
jgi:formate-dependent nitrite reductase membrane component NrfD